MLLNLLILGALIFLAYACFTLLLKWVGSHHLAVKLLGGAGEVIRAIREGYDELVGVVACSRGTRAHI